MNTDTYDILVDQIATAMKDMTCEQARIFAANLVALVNASLAGEQEPVVLETTSLLLPPPLRTVGALTAPWEAYQQVHETGSTSFARGPSIELLCTFPYSFRHDDIARRLAQQRGIRAGTLMTRLYEVINAAEGKLYLVCPYWSEMGVIGLTRHITRERMNGLNVVVLTRPKDELDDDNLRGVYVLQQELEIRGAEVIIKSPAKGRDGRCPLVHAKVVVRDGSEAYLGSANFSVSGMESSFEVGVLLQGTQANDLHAWAEALEDAFMPW